MSSKYDLVKVTVWASRPRGSLASDGHGSPSTPIDVNDSFYVLSRFVLARLLHFCEVPRDVAGRVALTVKKELVMSSTLDISHDDLVAIVVDVLRRHGVARHAIALYPIVEAHFCARVPMIIVLAAPPSFSSSSLSSASCIAEQRRAASNATVNRIATLLSSRLLNCTLLQTDALLRLTAAAEGVVDGLIGVAERAAERIVAEMSGGKIPLPCPTPFFEDTSSDSDSDLTCSDDDNAGSCSDDTCTSHGAARYAEWHRQCESLRSVLSAHAAKAVREGRALIISGEHIDAECLRSLLVASAGCSSSSSSSPVIKLGVVVTSQSCSESAADAGVGRRDDATLRFLRGLHEEGNTVDVTNVDAAEELRFLPCNTPPPPLEAPGGAHGQDGERSLLLDGMHSPSADGVTSSSSSSSSSSLSLLLHSGLMAVDAKGHYCAEWVHREVLSMIVRQRGEPSEEDEA